MQQLRCLRSSNNGYFLPFLLLHLPRILNPQHDCMCEFFFGNYVLAVDEGAKCGAIEEDDDDFNLGWLSSK